MNAIILRVASLRRGAQNERDEARAAATPSQQRLRRSSVAAALRAASAPSQQHQLDATRRMSANELVCAAATPSQLRRSSAARTMSGRRGIGQSSPSGKFAKNRGTPPSSDKPCFS